MSTLTRTQRIEALHEAARERILVLDGSWGAKIQELALTEEQFRGERFADHTTAMKGNTDILCLTQPDAVSHLLDEYFAVGADIVSTNTFTATSIAQADYDAVDAVHDINVAGAQLARAAADRATAADPEHRPRWVAGAIGPTNRSLSLSPDVEDPGARAVTYDEVYDTYREQVIALHEGGVDLLMIETIFDTLNAKAAIKAILDLYDEGYEELPLWISGTITDRSGRTLSGQTVEAFWASVSHAQPFAVGLNCALGADLMRPYIAELSRIADTLISAHPNAGLPNEMGEYDELPHQTSAHLGEWAQSGLVNIVGGCCGTTPEHIHALADAVRGLPPREVPEIEPRLRLSGLEVFVGA
jgi:5-methyltetrahydrofolate--homocysteine methyltransferase